MRNLTWTDLPPQSQSDIRLWYEEKHRYGHLFWLVTKASFDFLYRYMMILTVTPCLRHSPLIHTNKTKTSHLNLHPVLEYRYCSPFKGTTFSRALMHSPSFVFLGGSGCTFARSPRLQWAHEFHLRLSWQERDGEREGERETGRQTCNSFRTSSRWLPSR